MKILAVRGQNLASFADAFCLEFDKGPLRDSGVFAITGPTGAGKTTLLDAMCLALYDQTPRLEGRGGHKVGPVVPETAPVNEKNNDRNNDRQKDRDSKQKTRQKKRHRLSATDVRSILRKGSTNGFAEVDFLGVQGTEYRARWEVRRAHGKSSGRLQNQSIVLSELQTGRILGHTKTETLGQIQKCIGLSFEQFRRSVLLAQGEFAAFLRAPPRARSALLEKMTGTEIYTQISIQAHTSMTEYTRQLQDYHDQSQKMGLLLPIQKEELRRSLLDLEKKEAVLAKRLQKAEAQCRWFSNARTLQKKYTIETKTLAALQQEDKSLHTHRQTLLAWEQAQKFAAQHNRVTELKSELVVAEDLLARRIKATHAAQDTLQTTTQHTADLEAQHKIVQDQIQSCQQTVSKASSIQKQIVTSQEQLAKLRTKAASSEKAWQKLVVVYKKIVHDIDCLLAHPLHQDSFSLDIPESDARELQTLSQKTEALSARIEKKQDRIPLLQADIQRLETERKQQTKKREELASLLVCSDNLQTECTQAVEYQQSLQLAHTLGQQIGDSYKKMTHWQIQSTQSKKEMRNLLRKESRTKKALETIEESFLSMCNVLQQVENLVLASRLQETLVQGDPCIVCGSTQHPGNTDNEHTIAGPSTIVGPSTDAQNNKELNADAIHSLRKQKEKLKEKQSDLQEKLALLKRQINDSTSVSQRLTDSLELEQNSIDQHLAYWTDRHSKVPKPQPKDATNRWEETITKLETKQAETIATLQAKQLERQQKQSDYTNIERTIRSIEEQRDEAIQKQQKQRHELIELCDIHSHWQQKTLDKRHSVRMHATHKLATAHTSAEIAKRKMLFAKENHHTLCEEYNTKQDILTQWQQELDLLTGSHKIAHAEKIIADAVTIESRLLSARQRETKAHQDITARETEKDLTLTQQSTLLRQLESANNTYQESLLSHGWQAEDVERILATPYQTIERFEQELRDHEQTIAATKIRRQQRQSDWHEHERGRPAFNEHFATGLLETIQQDFTQTVATKSEYTRQWRNSELAEKQAEALTLEMKQSQKKADHYGQISDLIGSANGKKFRQYAQHVTLCVLVEHANRHLQTFTKRYQLQVSADASLEFEIVDIDLGGDVRSVHTLSGGEAFLVSLALSLGLSSVASGKLHIGSLLIDEGFGSLDAESLETTLAALDALHATGRQVGLISHVQDIAERLHTVVHVRPLSEGGSQLTIQSST